MKKSIIIRNAKTEDLKDINEIYNEGLNKTTYVVDKVSLEATENWFNFTKDKYPILVAELDGKIVGYSALEPFTDKQGYNFTAKTQTYIKKEFRGKSIGSKLRIEIIAKAKNEYSLHTLVSYVSSSNESSINLCKKLGFEQVGCLKEIVERSGQHIDLIIFQLILNK